MLVSLRNTDFCRFRGLACWGLLAVLFGFGCRSERFAPPRASQPAVILPATRSNATEAAEGNAATGAVQLTRYLESIVWPDRPKWRAWGEQNLQSGDLVFIRSNYRVLLGTFNLSAFLAEVADSPFSHVGLVVIEQNRPMVYDASDEGVTAQAFEKFVTDGKIERIAVCRLRAEHQHAIPAAIAFAQRHRQQKTRFDDRFDPSDEKLYCTELVIKAFREGGITLSSPTPVGDLPGLDNVAPMKLRMAKWSTHLSEEDLVWLPGNQEEGLYGSASLFTLLEPTPSPPVTRTAERLRSDDGTVQK